MRRLARSAARFPKVAAACVLVAALLLALPACGKKGPPVPADAEAQVPPDATGPAPPAAGDAADDDSGDDTDGASGPGAR
jgi:predicted small lipoprotein YifL